MATGGLLLEEVGSAGSVVLKVKHVGQFGPHAAAKSAGFQVGDVIEEYDGKKYTRETDVLAHGATSRKPGDRVAVTVVRDGKKVMLTLPMQE